MPDPVPDPVPEPVDVEIRRAVGEDDVLAAAHLFDREPLDQATARFVASPGHHLLVAWRGDRAVGFTTGVEMTHPDKGTEMFVYELGVEESHRRRGVARALLDALDGVARDAGCVGVWLVTEHDNEAARATYRRRSCEEDEGAVLYSWPLDADG